MLKFKMEQMLENKPQIMSWETGQLEDYKGDIK